MKMRHSRILGGHNLQYPVLWGSSVVIIHTRKVEILDMEARHASRKTQHNLRLDYAGHWKATTLVIDRYTISPILLFQVGEETLTEATYFPAI